MNFKDANLRFVLLKAVADAIDDELTEMRAKHLGPLLERYDAEAVKSFSVRLPGNGALIGALTLPEPKDKYEVVDEAAFTAWFAENHPDAVDVEVIPGEPERVVVIPATPDETVTTINPKHRTAILKTLDQTDDGEIVDSVTGSFVKGVKFTPGKRPDKFSVTYEPNGREHLARAYRNGELDGLVSGTSLPPAGDRVVVERVLVPAVTVVPAEPEVSPARAALEEYADDLAEKYAPGGQYDDRPAKAAEDEGPCRECGAPWALGCLCGQDDAGEFDPGSWGAPADQTAAGW